MSAFDFDQAFETLTEHEPFPWQRRLFGKLRDGDLPSAVDIPTGLGKTAAMAVWLLARAAGASLPRRLVYVVDRRAVVDQATDFAEQLREHLQAPAMERVRYNLGLTAGELAISTLRGQHVDNRQWLEDPGKPAIIVGTVDMVGSRLLFEGYGVSRRMRPYQAGLIGCDTLVLLDEAHLSRPFERLLRTIERERRASVDREPESAPGKLPGPYGSTSLPPPFRVLPLSATLGSNAFSAAAPFALNDEDRENETVHARLDAAKRLDIEDLSTGVSIDDVLAERAWDLASDRTKASGVPVRMLIYCDSRRSADNVAAELRRRERSAKVGAVVILFVGGRRVYERQEAADQLRRHGLLAGSSVPLNTSVFVVSTSAGEVGVDLDADHMVCDLVPWERMVQRLGRVNRRGLGEARVVVVDQGPPEKNSEVDVARHRAVRALLQELPRDGKGHRAGPAALENMAKSSEARTAEASTAPPLHPVLTRPLIDAWAMTSLAEHSGRPEVDPWLRGWVEDVAQTTVAWRRCLPVRVDPERSGPHAVRLEDKAVEAFFEAAALHPAERLETETWQVVEWLRKRARKLTKSLDGLAHRERASEVGTNAAVSESDGEAPAAVDGGALTAALHLDAPVAFVLDNGGKPDDRDGEMDCVVTWREAASSLTIKALERRLAGRLLVVDARICGLSHGLLDANNGEPVTTIEDNWGEPQEWDMAVRNGDETLGMPGVRVLLLSDNERDGLAAAGEAAGDEEGHSAGAWRESWSEPYHVSSAGLPTTWLIVETWDVTASDEDSHSMARLQRLEDHQEATARQAERIAEQLELGQEDRAMLVAAARRHDEGKRTRRWQRAFNAPREDGPYAKTPGPLNRHVLDGYRHEFQSMLDAEANGLDGVERSDPRFELALHLIAAHHGHARPAIGIEGCDGLPPTAAAREATTVGRRFARLQRQWGPWGLAWWEALLRAADQRASRALDEDARRVEREPGEKSSPTGAGEHQLGLFGGEGAR